MPDVAGHDPTPEELLQRKRIADRAVLLRHIDHIVRPPAWVYEEMEEAIGHAIEGTLEVRIESRDGRSYSVAELLEVWELDDMLETYRRAPDDPSYDERRSILY